jgi:formate-dependent nitrite reductase membrane component NrfD
VLAAAERSRITREGWVFGDQPAGLWALDITNFVFWIGISTRHSDLGDLESHRAEWRRPVTRCAEAITVFALMIGALFPIIHLGRPSFSLAGSLSKRARMWPISVRRSRGIFRGD